MKHSIQFFVIALITFVGQQARAGLGVPSILEKMAAGQQLTVDDKIDSYIRDCARDAQLNRAIPQVTQSVLRIMTYNIHFWTKPGGARSDWNYNPVFTVIDAINPDVIALQEVSFDKDRTNNQTIIDATRREIENLFTSRGYTHIVFQPLTPSKGFGNMIVSKVPFNEVSQKMYAVDLQSQRDEKRGYIHVRINDITLYATHLDVYDAFGEQREKELREVVQAMDSNQQRNTLLMGDFNAMRRRDYQYMIGNKSAWNVILKDEEDRFREKHPRGTYQGPRNIFVNVLDAQYRDCFFYVKKQMPRYTSWSGKVIDFIFLKKSWQLPIAGCYAYYTAASDHLPLIIDITTKK